MADKFIKLVDAGGNMFYVNPSNVSYLKETAPSEEEGTKYKVVLRDGNWVVYIDKRQFVRIRNELYGE